MDTARIECDRENHEILSLSNENYSEHLDGKKTRGEGNIVRNTFFVLLAFSIPFCVASCEKERGQSPAKNPVIVEVAPVKRGTMAKEIKLTGSIEANTTVQIYPKITAQIEEMRVDSGDTIKKGEVIVLLESDELQAQLAQDEAALETMQAKWAQMEAGTRPEELSQTEDLVAKAEANLKDAENNYQRMKALFRQGTIAKRQFETAELAYTVAKADLNSAQERLEMLREGATKEDREALKAQVSQAKAALDLAGIKLSYARIISPIDGTISERFLDPGNLAVPTKALVTIVQMDTVKVIVYFPENQLRYMERGIQAQITVAAYPSQVFHGRIDKVSPTLNPETRMFSAQITVLNERRLLRPGMFTAVTLSVDPHPDTLLVPKEAVLYREEYLEQTGVGKGKVRRNNYLFVVENGRAHMRHIVLGHESDTAVEVSEGLEQGDQIVVRGLHQLNDGDIVKVVGSERSGA
jgi:RND family efflux transporter MFP subunit